jgi:putative oxidoreductase
LWLRVIAGLGIAYHGCGKVFGDMTQMIDGVAQLGFPEPVIFAWAAALSEFAGGLAIAAGLLTRLAALSVLFTMGVAFFLAHAADPFSVKELAMLYGVCAGTLVLTGPGTFSIDGFLFRKR